MTDFSKARIAVLMGGPSAEREVSLESGAGVLQALRSIGCDATPIDWQEGGDLPMLLRQSGAEVVWNALHGTFGEDGAVQGLLTCMGIPYTGSGIAASALALDKARSKRFFEADGLPLAPSVQAGPDSDLSAARGLGLPVVVKPVAEGSSVGVTIVKDESQLAPAIEKASRPGLPAIIEKFIAGPEIAIGVLDGQALGSVEIAPATEFYDYEAKYKRDDTQYFVPPRALSPAFVAELEALAVRAHNSLGCESYSRVDFMVLEGKAYLIEVNTLPGMTSHSLLPKAAAHAGIDYAELCRRILLGAHP